MKAEDTSLFRRLLFMTITVGGSLVSQFGILILLAHGFGIEGMGIYAYYSAIASLIGLVSIFGFPVYLQRELSARPEEFSEVHSDALSFKLVLDSALIVVALMLPWLIDTAHKELLYLLVGVRIAISYNSFFLVEFRVLSAYKLESILSSAGNFLSFFMVLYVVLTNPSLNGVGVGLLLSRIFILLVVMVVWKRNFHDRLLRFSLVNIFRTLRRNIPYALDQGLAEFLMQMTSFLIGLLLGTDALGLYQAGQRIVTGVLTFTSIIMGAFISKLSALWRTDLVQFKREAAKASFLFHGIGLSSLIVFTFFGSYITELLYPDEFRPLNSLWPLFGLFVLARYCASVPGLLLVAAGFQKLRVQAYLVCVILFMLIFKTAMDLAGLPGILWLLTGITVLATLIYYYFVSRLVFMKDKPRQGQLPL